MIPMEEDDYVTSRRMVAYDNLEVHYRKADGTHRVCYNFTPYVEPLFGEGYVGGCMWLELHPDHAAEVMAERYVPFWEAFRKSPRPLEVSVAVCKGKNNQENPPYYDWHPSVTFCYSEDAFREAHPGWFTEVAQVPMDFDDYPWEELRA